jgi:endoglycosylceramidase
VRKAFAPLVALTLAVGAGTAAAPGAAPAAGVASPAAASPFHADSPFIRDAAGRVRFFHGVNAVWKQPPYYPPSSVYPSPFAVTPDKSFFDERDAAFLAENGLNSVRLGSLWVGAEPQRNVFDAAYLDRMSELVDMLGARGVTVMLDFHQDMYNERFGGEGFPAWATHNSVSLGSHEVVVPPTNCCGFPGNYFTPAALRAFDNLWFDNFGLWNAYRDAWTHVAARFAGRPNVLGYELMNEPWPGTQVPTCAQPLGCPVFDALFMQPFYERVIAGIRRADPSGMVFWDADVITNNGTANWVGLLKPVADPGHNLGLAFHHYCLLGGGFVQALPPSSDPLCVLQKQLVLQRQSEAAARNASAMFLTEFGATDDVAELARMTALADRSMLSWHYWHYGEWSDPTTSGVGSQGLFTNDLDRPGSLKQAKADVLIRTYPQAVAGTPLEFAFDPATKVFTLRFVADPSIAAPTEIFVPVARHYAGTYAVSVTGPASVTSAADAPLLTLTNTGAGVVTITVTKP